MDEDVDLVLGIITNAESWIFVQLDPSGKVYSKSARFPAGIDGERPAAERERLITEIFLTIHWLLVTLRDRAEQSKEKYPRIGEKGDSDFDDDADIEFADE